MRTQSVPLDTQTLLANAMSDLYPDARGRFGTFGSRYVPETLLPPLDRLQDPAAFLQAQRAS